MGMNLPNKEVYVLPLWIALILALLTAFTFVFLSSHSFMSVFVIAFGGWYVTTFISSMFFSCATSLPTPHPEDLREEMLFNK